MMADSGARGSMAQIRQLAGMRGLMANTRRQTIEIPIKANFREGLSVWSTSSPPKAPERAGRYRLRTADSGYLTRRLVDVCRMSSSARTTAARPNGIRSAPSRRTARSSTPLPSASTAATRPRLVDPADRRGAVRTDHHAPPERTPRCWRRTALRSKIRSVLTCEARSGVCAKCYGMNLATGEPVDAGEAVGIIAAQSIGEPGTQLTMRTFHTGGVAGDDITQGLPRVEELFEARKPKKMAQIAEIAARHVEETEAQPLNVTITADDGETVTYDVPYSAGLLVKDGEHVVRGTQLTEGAVSRRGAAHLRRDAAQKYIVQEVQRCTVSRALTSTTSTSRSSSAR